MARRRFLVALVPPDTLSEQLRALRSLTGGPARERIAPHVTLVPPFNLDARHAPEVRAVLRAAVTAAAPFELWLGPGSSFAPRNATLHLAVGGEPEAIRALEALRGRVRTGPIDRPDRHAFVPHLTLRRHAPVEMTDAAADVLSGRLGWRVDRLQLMEQVHGDEGTTWRPVTEEPFGGPVVVGRGGVELHLRTIRVVERMVDEPIGDDAAGCAGGTPDEDAGAVARSPERLVVVAERPGAPGAVIGRAVGVAGPPAARLHSLEVVPAARRSGVARQLLARWCTDAARAGAVVAFADTPHPEPLRALGFRGDGTLLTRRLPTS